MTDTEACPSATPNVEKRMKRLALPLLLVALPFFGIAPIVSAQDAPGTLAQVIVVDPLPGHAAALEEGAQQHLEWMRDAGGTWQWSAFEIVMGERTGSYVWGTFNHEYADFDTPDVDPQASSQSVDRNIAPHVDEVVVAMANLRPDLSMVVTDAPLRPMYEVVTFELNNGKDLQFAAALAMIKETFATAGGGIEYLVYQFAQGGSGQWVVSIPHESFSSMGGMDDAGFLGMMRQVHGEHGARNLTDLMDTSVARVTSEIFVLRPDLSANLPM